MEIVCGTRSRHALFKHDMNLAAEILELPMKIESWLFPATSFQIEIAVLNRCWADLQPSILNSIIALLIKHY